MAAIRVKSVRNRRSQQRKLADLQTGTCEACEHPNDVHYHTDQGYRCTICGHIQKEIKGQIQGTTFTHGRRR